jgi:hypothetical protein
MSTPHRHSGGTSEMPASNHSSPPVDPDDNQLELQLRAFLDDGPMSHESAHRDGGDTSEIAVCNGSFRPMQRSDPTDTSHQDPEDLELAVQLGAFLNNQLTPHTSSHLVANSPAVFRGPEKTYATTPTKPEQHYQNDVSQDVPIQDTQVPIGQMSSVRTMTFQEIDDLPIPYTNKPMPRTKLPATRT